LGVNRIEWVIERCRLLQAIGAEYDELTAG